MENLPLSLRTEIIFWGHLAGLLSTRVVSANCLGCGPDNGLNLHHKEAHLDITEVNSKQKPPKQGEAEMVLWVGSSQLLGICPVDLTRLPLQSEVAQSCPTLCDPMDCSLPGSSVHGIFQARCKSMSEHTHKAAFCPTAPAGGRGQVLLHPPRQ